MYGAPIEVANPQTGRDVIANAIAVRRRMAQRATMLARMSRLARMEKQIREDEERQRAIAELDLEVQQQKPVKRDFILVSSAPIDRIEAEEMTVEVARMRALVGSRREAFAHARKIFVWVCRRYGWSPQDLCGSRRQKNVVRARHLAMQLICHSDKCKILTLVQIGKLFGGKDHTTVLHAAMKAPSFRNARPVLDVEERAAIGGRRGAEVWS